MLYLHYELELHGGISSRRRRCFFFLVIATILLIIMASGSVTSLDMAAQVKAPLAINCTILFLVLIVVGMRIWTRVRGVGLGLDDGLVAVATVRNSLLRGKDSVDDMLTADLRFWVSFA